MLHVYLLNAVSGDCAPEAAYGGGEKIKCAGTFCAPALADSQKLLLEENTQ